jgi:hypothetical protein
VKFDYWHQHRYFRLEGSDEDLPFGEPPFVVGTVVTMAEPIWQSALATTLAMGSGRAKLPEWSWQTPLAIDWTEPVASRLEDVADDVERTGDIVVASDIDEDLAPDAPVVLAALRALIALLRMAAERRTPVQTWVD